MEENRDVMVHLRAATAVEDCIFQIHCPPHRGWEHQGTKELMTLNRFITLRARLACDRHDWETLSECVVLLNQAGRHYLQHADVILYLQTVASLSLACMHARTPFTWDDMSAADRSHYVDAIAPLFDPLPDAVTAIEWERDAHCWTVQQEITTSGVQIILPPERASGDIHKLYEPFVRFAAQSVEVQMNSTNPLWEKMASIEHSQIGFWSFVDLGGAVGHVTKPSLTPFFSLRGRIITGQRGIQTVAAVFLYADEHNQYPAKLDQLGAAYTIDPFTGQSFIYRVGDEDFTLYTPGFDGDDDGGRHDWRFGQASFTSRPHDSADGDYVFWPIPALDED